MPDFEALRKKILKKTRESVEESLSGKETHLIKAIGVIEDLDNVFNLLAEHAIDWHSMHFPELKRIVKDNEACLRLVKEVGSRKNFSVQNVEKHYQSREKAGLVAQKAKESIGAEFGEGEIAMIQGIAGAALEVKKQRTELSDYLSKSAQKNIPNLSGTIGAVLCTKILARAGSLKKLAFMPASKIQVIGAEKALYSHLKSGSPPPKHGIIFQLPQISSAKKKKRGKIARIVAAKISIAAKLDYFGGNDMGEKLRKEIEEKTRDQK